MKRQVYINLSIIMLKYKCAFKLFILYFWDQGADGYCHCPSGKMMAGTVWLGIFGFIFMMILIARGIKGSIILGKQHKTSLSFKILWAVWVLNIFLMLYDCFIVCATFLPFCFSLTLNFIQNTLMNLWLGLDGLL